MMHFQPPSLHGKGAVGRPLVVAASARESIRLPPAGRLRSKMQTPSRPHSNVELATMTGKALCACYLLSACRRLSHSARAAGPAPGPPHFPGLSLKMSSKTYSSEVRAALAAGGVFAVDKPKDVTSADVVQFILDTICNVLGGKLTKVGHGGTLDPNATGVLVLGVGSGTRMLQSFLDGSKAYEAEVMLGSETDTQDCKGSVVAEAAYDHVTNETLDAALPSFIGDIQQVPPMYSALKVNGQRLYRLAHRGIGVERKARQVTVHKLQVLNFKPPRILLNVECGKGLYIRTLGTDLAHAVGSRGHVSELRRTRSGEVNISDCLSIEEASDAERIANSLQQKALPTRPPSHRRQHLLQQARPEPSWLSRRSTGVRQHSVRRSSRRSKHRDAPRRRPLPPLPLLSPQMPQPLSPPRVVEECLSLRDLLLKGSM